MRGGRGTAALRAVAANPDLRRLQLAWLGANVGHGAYFVGVSLYAFEHGGAAAVGLAAVVRMLPSALATPFAAALADRHSRRLTMLVSDLLRAAMLVAAAIAASAGGPLSLLIVLTTLAGLAYTPFEPAKAALTPGLARTPEELAAANVASSGIESVTLFVGPAAAGVAVALGGAAEALWLAAAMQLWSAWFVARLTADAAPAKSAAASTPSVTAGAEETDGVGAGLRAAREDPRIALILGLLGAQTFAFGAFSVLVIVLAVDVLGTGDAGVGYLNAALGVGALLGAIATLGLVGSRFLGRGLGLGVALWGAPLALAGVTGNVPLALALLVVIGFANTLVDVTYITLLQRIAPAHVLARVFGLMETVMLLTIALGNVVAPLLITTAGERVAFLLCGGLLPLAALAAYPLLARIDAGSPAPARTLETLRSVPLFRPLGPAALEELARHAELPHFGAGEAIVTQGEPGERFFVVISGKIAIDVDGRRVDSEGPGAHFGEIALLREVPRTATVSALTPVETLAIGREDFLAAVGAHPQSGAIAEGTIGARLARARPATGPLL